MLALRQLAAFIIAGAQSDMGAASEYDAAQSDVNPRYVLKLRDDGRFAADSGVVASGGGSFSLPLPQNYSNINRLFVLLRTDQVIKFQVVTPSATNKVLVNAGATQGVISFVDFVNSITLTNAGGTNANVEWFLFELPDITATGGWRDGALALGTV